MGNGKRAVAGVASHAARFLTRCPKIHAAHMIDLAIAAKPQASIGPSEDLKERNPRRKLEGHLAVGPNFLPAEQDGRVERSSTALGIHVELDREPLPEGGRAGHQIVDRAAEVDVLHVELELSPLGVGLLRVARGFVAGHGRRLVRKDWRKGP